MYSRSFYSPLYSSFFPNYLRSYTPFYSGSFYSGYGYPYAYRSFYPYSRYPLASFHPARCSRVEYIPIEKSCIDYVPQARTEYVPCERRYTDYMEVQHDIDYVPVPRVEKYIEYVPQETYCTRYDYQPVHKSQLLRQPMHENNNNNENMQFQNLRDSLDHNKYPYQMDNRNYKGRLSDDDALKKTSAQDKFN